MRKIRRIRAPKLACMKPLSILITSATLAAAVALPPIALAQPVELAVVDVKVVERGWRASKLIGKSVTNEQNQRIGEVNDIIIGKDGQTYAVLEVGGFLGLGEKLVAVPYRSLQVDERANKVVLPGASREALVKLPVFKHVT
jgi:sporulation protein YlmC with PRC-barrel domain